MKRKKHETKFKKRKLRVGRFLFFSALIVLVLLVALNFITNAIVGVSVVTLAQDALAVTGVTTPTVEEIKELPVEEVSENINEFIEVFNEAGEAPEEIELEEGLTGVRVVDDNGDVIEEITLTVVGEEVTNIDYSGIDSSIAEEEIVEIPEDIFRIIFSGELPESLPNLLKAYSESGSLGN